MNEVSVPVHRRTPVVVLVLVLATALLVAACGSTPGSDKNVSAEGGAAGAHDVAPAADPDWCSARSVLEAKCWRCHADPPEHGAPFSLLTYDDTQITNAKGSPRFVAIEAAVATDLMPARFIMLEPEVQPLTDSEKQTLLDWCGAGAPAARDADCDGPP